MLLHSKPGVRVSRLYKANPLPDTFELVVCIERANCAFKYNPQTGNTSLSFFDEDDDDKLSL